VFPHLVVAGSISSPIPEANAPFSPWHNPCSPLTMPTPKKPKNAAKGTATQQPNKPGKPDKKGEQQDPKAQYEDKDES
jgi:hypothetical protein